MSHLFHANRRLLVLTVVFIVIAGLSAYHTLSRLEDSEIVQRAAFVNTRFAGADVARVESLVTEKIERKLFEIEEIKTLDSVSRTGISTVSIMLKDEAAEVDDVWSRVRDKLRGLESELPSGAEPPVLEEVEIRAYSLIVALTWDQDDQVCHAVLRRLAKELEDVLRAIGGTEKVELFGAPDEEITVEIKPSRLASLGLSAADVSRQIELSDSKNSAGVMRGRTAGDLIMEVQGRLDCLERIRQIPIHHGRKGQIVSVGDVAIVKKGIREPVSDLALVDGKPAVAIGVFAEPRCRLDHWAEAARTRLDQFGERLPRGVGLTLVFDQSRYTSKRLGQLMNNRFLGVLGVLGVTFVMMGWRSAVIVSCALPLSVLMVFAGMQLLGIPIHQMSVTGLILALGLLIDNAIVVVDEVRQRLESGMAAETADA